MRVAVLGCLVVAILVAAVSVVLPDDRAVPGREAAPSGAAFSDRGLLAFSETVAQKYQQVTVIDPKREVMSVYHVDLASGTITLRSVRTIRWDLQMSDYNGQRPLPREIQALSEQR
jgi:hypothetical protein